MPHCPFEQQVSKTLIQANDTAVGVLVTSEGLVEFGGKDGLAVTLGVKDTRARGGSKSGVTVSSVTGREFGLP